MVRKSALVGYDCMIRVSVSGAPKKITIYNLPGPFVVSIEW